MPAGRNRRSHSDILDATFIRGVRRWARLRPAVAIRHAPSMFLGVVLRGSNQYERGSGAANWGRIASGKQRNLDVILLVALPDAFELQSAFVVHDLVSRTGNRRALIRGPTKQEHVPAENMQYETDGHWKLC